MITTTDKISTLLNSIAAVLIFLSIEHFIDSTFAPYSLLMIIGGTLLLFTAEIFAKIPLDFITKSTINIVSHILIFIGLQSYLQLNIESLWFVYGVVGFILLSNHRLIADKLTGK